MRVSETKCLLGVSEVVPLLSKIVKALLCVLIISLDLKN